MSGRDGQATAGEEEAAAAQPGILGLPADLTMLVAQFAGAEAVCRASEASSEWRAALGREDVWRALCADAWEDKDHIDVETVEEFGMPARYASTCGMLLVDGVAALQDAQPAKRQRVADGAGAGQTVDSWKKRYEAALRDSRRAVITTEELCSLTWSFRMRRPGEATAPHDPLPEGCDEVHDFPYYLPDNTYKSQLFEQFLPWRMVRADEDVEQAAGNGAAAANANAANGANNGAAAADANAGANANANASAGNEAVVDRVLVGDYPPLVCQRTDTWGWFMSNMWVTFRSLDFDRDECMAQLKALQEATGTDAPHLQPGQYPADANASAGANTDA